MDTCDVVDIRSDVSIGSSNFARAWSAGRCPATSWVSNDEAREGWMLKHITHADVKGRIGPGAVEGLILTFERPVAYG